MTPLDLTQQAPRSCRVELDGIAYVSRAIDKARAALPGGNVGPYLIINDDGSPTISSLFYRHMGITDEEFTAAVRDARTDDDVAAWLRPRVNADKIAAWHRFLLGLRVSDIPSPARETVYANHPCATSMPETSLLVDVFDADDAAMFAQKS